MQQPELKNCPFCGASAQVLLTTDAHNQAIVCNSGDGGCGTRGPYKSSGIDARKAWNTRSELRALAGAEVGGEPDVALLASMACCLNHGFGLNNPGQQERQLRDMRKLWDEMMGRGFYSPENRERYLSMVALPPPPGSGGGGLS